jgi:hypothetical protein
VNHFHERIFIRYAMAFLTEPWQAWAC